MNEKIKISAPRSNPHICYISREYEEQIKALRRLTKMSTYAMLCEVSGYDLSFSENIAKFKAQCREKGFRNIGDWATEVVRVLYEARDHIHEVNLSTLEVYKHDHRS